MMSRRNFDIYQRLTNDDSIIRVDSRTYLPFIKSFENNDTIEIAINRPDVWLLMYESAVIIKGTLEKTNGAGTVQLVNNAGAFLFDSISYELSGVEMDSVREPGIVTSVRSFLCYEPNENREMGIAGWTYPNQPVLNADGSFYFRIPLKHLLNIFNDYQMAICGKQLIRFVRARNDNNAMKISAGVGEGVGTTKGKITIHSIELRVKHVYPNDVLKMELLESIKIDRPLLIAFRRWELSLLPSLTVGSTKEIWNVKTTSVVNYPRYVICCFQTDRKDNVLRDSGYFDNLNISDVRLLMNGEFFPQEQMRLDFNQNDYAEAHYNYSNFGISYMNRKKSVVLDYEQFKSRSIFVIDCSRRDETFKNSTIDIKLEIESRIGFPASTTCYCIICHDAIMEYLPLSEVVKRVSTM